MLWPLKEAGFETIMINCNPETVSTDYDTSDRLYFEPLKEEYVFNIIKKEKEKGKMVTIFTKTYGCGDTCIDMNGCGPCKNTISDKVENVLNKFPEILNLF